MQVFTAIFLKKYIDTAGFEIQRVAHQGVSIFIFLNNKHCKEFFRMRLSLSSDYRLCL